MNERCDHCEIDERDADAAEYRAMGEESDRAREEAAEYFCEQLAETRR